MFTVWAKTKQPFDLSRSLCSFLLETVLKPEVWNRYYYEMFFQDGMIQFVVRITCQRSVFLSNRQDNEALIIIRLSFQMLLDCLDSFLFFFFFWVKCFIHLKSEMVTYVTINQMVKFDSWAIYQGDKLMPFKTVCDNWISLHLESNILFLNSVFK